MAEHELTVRFASRVARAGFTVAYNVVIFDRSLSVHARLLYLQLSHYAYLCEHAKRDSPEQTEIAANLGIKERAMRPYIRELEAAGLVEVRRRGRGLTHLYTIVEPSEELLDRQNTAGLDRQSTTPQTGKKLPLHREGEDGKTASSKELARRAIYDALVEACYPPGSKLTQREARKVALAANNIGTAGGTAAQVPVVKRRYLSHTTYGKCALTAWALSSHWAELAPSTNATGVCERCGLGGGRHAADCQLAEAS